MRKAAVPEGDLAGAARAQWLLSGEDRVCWPPGIAAVRASGGTIDLFDTHTGSVRAYDDLVCGYGAFNFGHRPAPILRALARGLATLDGAGAIPTAPCVSLARRLVELCAFQTGRCYFTAGGSQAVEIALRIARLLSGRQPVAVVTSAFHGYGAQTLRLSRDFVPEASRRVAGREDVLYLPWNDARAVERLRAASRTRRAPGTLLVEPVLGAGGFRVPDPAWFVALLEAARAADMVTVLDEIQVGMGRTGRALSVENLIPSGRERQRLVDAVTLSKSLAGGVWPLSAIVLGGQRLGDLSGLDLEASLGETFSNNPAGCAAAHAALDLMQARDGALLRMVRVHGERMLGLLRRAVTPHQDHGIRARGLGLALALDFPDKDAARRFVAAAFEEHMICYVSGGRHFATVKLIPPLTTPWTRLLDIAGRVSRALARVVGPRTGGRRLDPGARQGPP